MAPDHSEYAGIDSLISPTIERMMRQKQITGLSIGLVDENDSVFVKGFGFADQQAEQAVTPQTIFRIGSITKVFTATAAMQLSEKGLLDIDKPVIEYLPDFSIKSRGADPAQITPRTLMTHHSGLPVDWYTGYWDDDPHAFRHVVEYLRQSYLAFPSNTVFSYSNLGMSLLGVILEKVSGLSYQQLIEQNIFAPLSMDSSATTIEKVPPARLSKAYARGKEVEEPSFRDAPAGCILSNVQDMGRFISMILGGGTYQGKTILKTQMLAEMFRPQNEAVNYDLGFRIGLNWILNRPELASAGKAAWHDGGSPHFFSMLIVLPEVKIGVIALTNSDGGMGTVVKIAEEALKGAIAAKTGKRPASASIPAPRNTTDKTEPATILPGTYASVTGLVRIEQRKNSLLATMQGQQFLLSPEGGGWYSLRLMLLGILPIKVAAVERLRLLIRSIDGVRILGLEQEGLQVPIGAEFSPVPIPETWTRALGRYQVAHPGKTPPFSTLYLEMKAGVLQIRAIARKVGRFTLVLKPLSDSECITLGLGRFAGETIELILEDGLEKMHFLGLELVKAK